MNLIETLQRGRSASLRDCDSMSDGALGLGRHLRQQSGEHFDVFSSAPFHRFEGLSCRSAFRARLLREAKGSVYGVLVGCSEFRQISAVSARRETLDISDHLVTNCGEYDRPILGGSGAAD